MSTTGCPTPSRSSHSCACFTAGCRLCTSPPWSLPHMSLSVLMSFSETQSQGLSVNNHQHPLSLLTCCTIALPCKRHFIFPHAQSQPAKLSLSQSLSSTKKSFILSETTLQAGAGYYDIALSLHVTRPKQPGSVNLPCDGSHVIGPLSLILEGILLTFSSSSPPLQNTEPHTRTHCSTSEQSSAQSGREVTPHIWEAMLLLMQPHMQLAILIVSMLHWFL